MELVERVLRQDQRAIARCLSLVEAGGAEAQEIVSALYPHTGQARIIGITGAPGSGKSTLISALAREYLQRGVTVGVIAIDPSSPFSGGAILGDRLRIQGGQQAAGALLFIRSMANRGRLGGLAQATDDAIHILDAAGFMAILVETVGVGQDEVDVATVAQSTLVLQTPGMGDDIQAIKAGILEIADIYVVNKADRLGADELVGVLEAMIALGTPPNAQRMRAWRHSLPYQAASGHASESWKTPVLKTVANTGEGVNALIETLERHAAHLRTSGRWQIGERERIALQLYELLRETLTERFLSQHTESELVGWVEQVATRQMDLYTALKRLLSE
jgi:LAO/AO transport system kinase